MDISTHQSNIAAIEQKISSLESDIQEYVALKHPKTKIQLLAENDFQLTQLTTQLTQDKEERLILLRQQQTQQDAFGLPKFHIPSTDSGIDLLCAIHPDIQNGIWNSIVQITIEDSAGTAIIVNETDEHFFILTNLHLFDFEGDVDYLSDDFKDEIKKPFKKNVQQPHTRAKRKLNQIIIESPKVVICRLKDDGTELITCATFHLTSDHCFKSSAYLDYAIFKVSKSDFTDLHQLRKCEMSENIMYSTRKVHIFGFPGAVSEFENIHSAIIPAQITGQDGQHLTLSTLSSPGLSGSAIVCTTSGTPIGYLGGGLDSGGKNQQYQSYGFSFYGIRGVLG